jgi:hypothetical protein
MVIARFERLFVSPGADIAFQERSRHGVVYTPQPEWGPVGRLPGYGHHVSRCGRVLG